MQQMSKELQAALDDTIGFHNEIQHRGRTVTLAEGNPLLGASMGGDAPRSRQWMSGPETMTNNGGYRSRPETEEGPNEFWAPGSFSGEFAGYNSL